MDATFLPRADVLLSAHIIPYAIILANYLLFKALRSLVNKIFAYYLVERQSNRDQTGSKKKKNNAVSIDNNGGWAHVAKLFLDELISTLELCADCAELNVVYEKHGTLAYGLVLFLLTYLWMDAFGDAQTSPGYLVEDYFLVDGNQLLKSGSTYARFVGQSLAMPLAWRFASFYWGYKLLGEHEQLLVQKDNCKSALNTSTLNGFLVEFICCLMCRLLELIGHKLLERKHLSQRMVSLTSSFICTGLVVLALELSGGYFNPVLAASLEYGCEGITTYQHAFVFWLGPLLGHLTARGLFKRFVGEQNLLGSSSSQHQRSPSKKLGSDSRRLTRASSQRKKRPEKSE